MVKWIAMGAMVLTAAGCARSFGSSADEEPMGGAGPDSHSDDGSGDSVGDGSDGGGGSAGVAGGGGTGDTESGTGSPWGCGLVLPGVFGIDVESQTGFVAGWLDSVPMLVVWEDVPYFGSQRMFDEAPAGSIRSWWSLASAEIRGERTVNFYSGDVFDSLTELAVADGDVAFSEINVNALEFGTETPSPIGTRSTVVFRNLDALQVVMALRLESVVVTEGPEAEECVGLEATWALLP